MMKSGEDNLRQFVVQDVEFSGREEHHTVEIVKANVNIIPSPGGHNHGSSKVKLKNIVDYTWEHRYYVGQLLAVHMSGKYLAYGIKGGNGNGMVRVVNQDSGQRTLIKGMQGTIQDLAFAHVSNPILACVDYTGSLFVYSIEATNGDLICTSMLQVEAEDTAPISHRVIWCPYIPDDPTCEQDDVSKLLTLTRGSKVELWSVSAAAACFNSPIKVSNPAIKENGVMLELFHHSGTVIEATFSPDGTALATAGSDGEVKFFQIYSHGDTFGQQPLKCLHQWKPHDGRPISSLFFLDDHKNYNGDAQYWRFAITGCDNNSELKLWSCEMWRCLQTIKFSPAPNTQKLPVLKASLDLAGAYLLLSDIYNKVLYILGITKDRDEAAATINTISEFLLPYPILSFAIVDAGHRHVKPTGSLEDLCQIDDESEDQLVIKMYLVQPKSLQECHIAYKPPCEMIGTCPINVLTHKSMPEFELIERVNGLETNDEDEVENGDDGAIVETVEININHSASLNLMTPDAFSSPAKKDSDSKSASPQLVNVEPISTSISQTVQALDSNDQSVVKSKEQAPTSGGSSPSREVREILCLTDLEENDQVIKAEPVMDAGEDWAQVPMCKLTNALHTMQEQGKEKPAENQINIKVDPSPVAEMMENQNSKLNGISNDVFVMNNKLDSILELVQEQQQELYEVRLEVERLRQDTPIVTRIETAIATTAQQQNNKMDLVFFDHMNKQQELVKCIETNIKGIIETIIPGCIQNFVEPLKHQLRLDTSQIDHLVKDNLNKTMNSSQMRDALANSAASAAKPALENAFREAFTGILLPGMEKACQNMFKQVQDTFLIGTREYLQNVDSIMENQYQRQNKQQSEALAKTVRDELQSEFSRGLSVIQENTMRSVRDSVKENFTQHMSNISGISSRATTPGLQTPSPADMQARVMAMLQRGQFNSAFQQALSASDLGLVVYTCENTDPARVFSFSVGTQGNRCILQQHVLLSLIQQLSANLGHRTELKHRWLEEAVISLDASDPITREHMPSVLMSLQSAVQAFITANPNHRTVRRLKMVAMAARSLLKPS